MYPGDAIFVTVLFFLFSFLSFFFFLLVTFALDLMTKEWYRRECKSAMIAITMTLGEVRDSTEIKYGVTTCFGEIKTGLEE